MLTRVLPLALSLTVLVDPLTLLTLRTVFLRIQILKKHKDQLFYLKMFL